jgi:integrase
LALFSAALPWANPSRHISVGNAVLGCHAFRATGITVYLLNGGLLEYAQQMAAHESARTTELYDRRNDQVTLDQVERIVL